MKANILVYDVGSTYTKAAAFLLEEGRLAFVRRAQSPTTVSDIQSGIAASMEHLRETGVVLSEAAGVFASSSAAGGLRMAALGYMPKVTVKAAKEVAMNAGARVLEVLSHEDPPEYRLQILKEINPDIILLAGGTDGGDEASLTENAEIIAEANGKAVTILAGNRQAQPLAASILEKAGKTVIRTPNVMPTIHELRVKPAREAIHREFIKQITRARGLNGLLESLTEKSVIPTPGAVLLAAELLANGTYNREGLGPLLVIDLGGATTDIHSVLPELNELPDEERGLIVTNEKQMTFRTVEGNLGLRVSACGVLETAGAEAVLARVGLSGGNWNERLTEYAARLEQNPEHIASSEDEKRFDTALASTAVQISLKRHAGYVSEIYDEVMGIVPGMPLGRDLRGVKNVIAVGGIFAYCEEGMRLEILSNVFRKPGISLLPEAPRFLFDTSYILYAIGVIASKYPDEAFDFARQYFNF